MKTVCTPQTCSESALGLSLPVALPIALDQPGVRPPVLMQPAAPHVGEARILQLGGPGRDRLLEGGGRTWTKVAPSFCAVVCAAPFGVFYI